MGSPNLSVVVPSLGSSPWLVECLEALRRDGGPELEIVLVLQGGFRDGAAEALADRVVCPEKNLGFAAANNLAFAAAEGEYLATVNDDAVVSPGWCRTLVEVLAKHPDVAAVQGVNVMLKNPNIIDGAGIGWNRSWQAVQIGRGRRLEELGGGMAEVFGVSATAAVYRRSALEAVSAPELRAFDERLFAYYEDVDLACRLRGAGYRALRVPMANAGHAGSVSGKRLAWGGRMLLYGNRHLVLVRLLGRAFWRRWPRIWWRDVVGFGRAVGRGDWRGAGGIITGWLRAKVFGIFFIRFGAPLVPLEELRRFRVR